MTGKSAPLPPGDRETIRRRIAALLSEETLGVREISAAVHRPQKEIAGHLEHLRKSLRAEGRRLVLVPAACRECGFVFRKRERLTSPGRCPVCRAEAVSDPAFRIEAR